MRRFIDPKLYLYSDDEWERHLFESRLEALTSALLRFSETERQCDELYRLFTFKVSEELDACAYSFNPLKSSSEVGSHYAGQFKNRVLPELRRRQSYCMKETCLGRRDAEPDEVPCAAEQEDERGGLFRSMLRNCAACGDRRKRCLVYEGSDRTLLGAQPFFAREVDIAKQDAIHLLLDPCGVFPDAVDHKRNERLQLAVRCHYEGLAAADADWRIRRPCDIVATESFWTSLEQAHFRGQDRLYKNQILYALVQICCGRDITVNEHRMRGQHIRFDGQSHKKWNAYVFKMGASETDKRCSRLYYAKSGGGILLEAFEGDAHP